MAARVILDNLFSFFFFAKKKARFMCVLNVLLRFRCFLIVFIDFSAFPCEAHTQQRSSCVLNDILDLHGYL
mgnify:CR=1 FL=1